jgi:VWFA-related protein
MKRSISVGAIALAMIALVARSDKAQSPPSNSSANSAPQGLTIPSGQKFILQLETDLHTRTTRVGDRVEFSTAADVVVDNQTAIPNRTLVRGTVTKSKRAGRLGGKAEIQLRFDEVRLADGSVAPVHATITRVGYDPVSPNPGGDPKIKGDAGPGGNVGAVIAGGAQGAIIGVLTAGAKGAIYGGAAGAAITAAGMIFKRGPDLDLPRSTMFEATFDQPLEVPAAALQPPAPAAPQAPGPAAPKAFPEIQTTVPATEEHGSQPRPKLVRNDPDRMPPVENPPAAKPAENSPAASPPSTPAPGPGAPHAEGTSGLKVSVKVRMVVVDAVVRDRAGRMIDNLTRDDFQVLEDNVPQEVQSFSRDELPLAVALVIDRSGSEAPYISELRRIADETLQQLKPEDQVALFSFAGNVERLEDLTDDRQRIVNAISRIRAGGGTDIIDALYDSVTYLAKSAPDQRHAVILISDNQATVRPQASEGETIRKATESETVVYSIKTGGQGSPLASRLPSMMMGAGSVGKVTQETGGEIIDVANARSLDAAMRNVISRLRMRYSLGYYAPNPAQGAFHSIIVRLSDAHGKPGTDYVIHARRGYYSTADQKRP